MLAGLTQRQRLRTRLANLVGARTEDIAIVSNTTEGVVDIAQSFPWRKGDRVLLFEGEFPANVTPWQRAAELFGLEIVWLSAESFARSSEEALDALRREARAGLRLVAVSAVQFQTGFRMPVEAIAAICREHDTELFVDAVQACGVVPLNVGCGIDYLSCGGHKWLMSVEGTGFLYVNPRRVEALRPNLAGWLSHENPTVFLTDGAGHLRYDRPIRRRADAFERSSPNFIGCAAFEAAVAALLALGVDAINAHVTSYLDALEAALVRRGFTSLRAREPAARSGILGVLPPANVDVLAVRAALARRGFVINVPSGVLRFAPHWPNPASEVNLVVGAVDEVLCELYAG
jgi:selenocysteine lyase/cysteine desulfurase